MSAAPPVTQERRTAGIGPLVALSLVLTTAAATTIVATGDRQVSDAAGRVTVSVPRTWIDRTGPDAGEWVGMGEGRHRVRDLKAGNLLAERSVGAQIEPREQGLTERHLAEVDDFCYSRACVDRGRPAAVEVNGRPGLEQLLHHAGEEWTVLLTLESDRYLVTMDGRAGEFSTGWTIEQLRRIVRTTVITD